MKRAEDKKQATARSVKIQTYQKQARSGDSGIIDKDKTSKRSRSRRPCQPGGQGPLL